MSGKPASVGAPRASAPRVLLYVADPRQLEPGAAGPEPPPALAHSAPAPPAPAGALYHDNSHHHLPVTRNPAYRTQVDQHDHGHSPSAYFYKQLNDNDSKLSAHGAAENTVVQRAEYFPVSQQFINDSSIKADDSKIVERSSSGKRDECGNSLGTDYGIESFRIPSEAGEVATYQTRCSGPLADNIMPSLQSVALCQTQNQFDSSAVESERTNCSERELSVGKSYVNYQFLEQNVSHQSIVNQSINILNQQVGVSRGIVSEGDSGTGPQLVRTADGVVLAVLPSSVLPQPSEAPELSSRTHSESPQTITVPLGWRRVVNGASVLYIR